MICIISKEVVVIYLILIIFLLVCGGLAVLTVFDVTTQVHLTVMSWQSPDLPIGIWLLIAFFLGSFLFYLIQVVEARGDRRELKRSRDRIATLEKELTDAKATSSSTSSATDTSGMAGAQPMSMARPSSPTIPNPIRSSTPPLYHKKNLMPMPGTAQSQQDPHQDSLTQNFRQ